jgi:hypothetical protein
MMNNMIIISTILSFILNILFALFWIYKKEDEDGFIIFLIFFMQLGLIINMIFLIKYKMLQKKLTL